MIYATDIIGSSYKNDEIVPFLVEVLLPDESSSSFLRVRETLTRIGVASSKPNEENTLFQSCHILKKRGKFYIVHFKTLFVLDGRDNALTMTDVARSNMITKLLSDWGLVTIVRPEMIANIMVDRSKIKIVNFDDKESWVLKPKYSFGSRQKEI